VALGAIRPASGDWAAGAGQVGAGQFDVVQAGAGQVGAGQFDVVQAGVARVAAVPINLPYCLRSRIRFVGALAADGCFAFDVLAKIRRSASAQPAHQQCKGRQKQETAQAP
jgi:hypothetical protein